MVAGSLGSETVAAGGDPVDALYAILPPGNHPNHGHTMALPEFTPSEIEDGVAWEEEAASRSAATAAAVAAAEAAALVSDFLPPAGGGGGGSISGQGASSTTTTTTNGNKLPSPSAAPLSVVARKLNLATGVTLPGIMSIILTRDTDGALIPYDSVHGITLITGLRLGILGPLRARAYHQFVSLPLYEDMAPWNIVFLGGRLDYIDYDTRDKTYDALVPKAYEIMVGASVARKKSVSALLLLYPSPHPFLIHTLHLRRSFLITNAPWKTSKSAVGKQGTLITFPL